MITSQCMNYSLLALFLVWINKTTINHVQTIIFWFIFVISLFFLYFYLIKSVTSLGTIKLVKLKFILKITFPFHIFCFSWPNPKNCLLPICAWWAPSKVKWLWNIVLFNQCRLREVVKNSPYIFQSPLQYLELCSLFLNSSIDSYYYNSCLDSKYQQNIIKQKKSVGLFS